MTLPPEVWRMIFASLDDKKALSNLLITSRQLNQLAEPAFHARIFVSLPPMFGIPIARLESLLDALETSNGRRAPYV